MEKKELYESPAVEVIEIVVEQGFATSGNGESGDEVTNW